MRNYFRGLIRASSFFQKEILEILRQPRLVVTLVVGPFLILFIVGIGYRAQGRTWRTLFVAQPDSPITAQDLQRYGGTMGPQFVYVGATGNLAEALDRLQREQVDLVIVEPKDITNTLRNNQQAVFTVHHNEIDPVQVSFVNYVGWLFASEVNQQVLRSLVTQGQADTVDLHTRLQQAHQNLSAMRQALQSGDEALAKQQQQGLAGNVGAVSQAADASLLILDSVQATQGANGGNIDPVKRTLADLRQNTNQLSDGLATNDQRLARLDKIDQDLTDLDAKLAEFQRIDPSIVVSPFRGEAKSVANIQPSIPDFYAPAVLALLLQHLAVTFAALSIVRERNAGTLELFRVSPLSAAEALFGKYISFMLFGGVIAAILSALLVFALHVPMQGNWWYYAVVIAAVLFTSLGIGFVISIVSRTDSQAVQYTMIVLLASVFFTGFTISLDLLWEPVRVISWLLPTTYGTLLLRNIALRGADPNWVLLGGLIALGLVLMLISWRLMRRLIASSQ